jgi:hypothetical protein
MRKFLTCKILTFRLIYIKGRMMAHAVTVNASFLQNLKQLRTNLVSIWCAANTRDGQLDVATIALYLHTNLQQSAFTDTAGVHAAGVLPAVAPASPFKVDSGKSAWQSFPGNIPLHVSAQPWANINPAVRDDPAILAPIDAGLLAAINAANATGFAPAVYAGVDHGRIVDDNRRSFNNMNPRLLQPGEILVRCTERCTENGALEPGEWWVGIGDMPLSIANIRNGIDVRPDWNQNGNLEFFVVPEGSAIVVIEGRAASYQLSLLPPKRFFQLAAEEYVQRGQALIVGVDVTNQWLSGGDNQILIIANSYGQRRPIFTPYGFCIAIIETGFDVELSNI